MSNTNVPVFDHNGTVGIEESNKPRRKALLQGGHRWTFAEYDKHQKRYIPEPQYIPEGKLTGDELHLMFERAIYKMGQLEVMLNEIQKAVMDNMVLILEDREKYQKKAK